MIDEYNNEVEPALPHKRYTIVCDFDGVIHQYTTRFERADLIPDPPVPGALDWLRHMAERWDIVIFSARWSDLPTPQEETMTILAVLDWFSRYGFDCSQIGVLDRDRDRPIRLWLGRGKPTGLIYIDDRGYRFEGQFPTHDEIHRLRPWKHTP